MKNLFLILFTLGVIGSRVAFAAQYDIKEMTPQVQQAIQGRQARFQQLQTLKAQGLIGEDNQGFVAVLKSGGDTDAVVSAENKDRSAIYQTIVQQNNLGADGLGKVKSVFAEVQSEKARSGDFIQTSAGQWIQK